MRKLGLTRMQRECLLFITEYAKEKGFPPSFEEMKEGLGLKSKSGVHRLIVALEERGHIIRSANRARSVELVTDETFEADLSPEVRRQIKTVAGFLKTTPSVLIERALSAYLNERGTGKHAA